MTKNTAFPTADPSEQSIFRKIRVNKEDSVFVYALLEAYEGITMYSTLAHDAAAPFRDLELRIAPNFLTEVEELLLALGTIIYFLD